ncbi:2-dehydropantoate 2-reductase [bacterium]|nr:2-dehydropantoate 2-reductase [bacterium]
MRIAIVGLGGVGGFIGARLAAAYTGIHDIIFFARGDHAKAIQSSGLKLQTHQGEIVARPLRVTQHAEEAGLLDFIICCVKSYDLETAMEPLRPCVHDTTMILPLLNGVDAAERLDKFFPGADVLDGCIYIVARLTGPGIVKVSGTTHLMHFGDRKGDAARLQPIEMLLKTAGIETHLSSNIQQTMWEKFLFISPIATLTSYLDRCLGEILSREDDKKQLVGLMTELKIITGAKRIVLSDNIMDKHLAKMATLPYDTTSSMHSDFKKGGRTEIDSLTGYVVTLGKELGIPTPLYQAMFEKLSAKK